MVCRTKPQGDVIEIRMVAPNGKIVATGHVSPPSPEAYEVWSVQVLADLHRKVTAEDWPHKFGRGFWTTQTAQ